ncbi:hypothetical protein JCM10207_003452 [Rhodosporidiobolus poonsookiae]
MSSLPPPPLVSNPFNTTTTPIQTTTNTLDASGPPLPADDIAHPVQLKAGDADPLHPHPAELTVEQREQVEREAQGEGGLAKITSGLGGMVLSAPLAALEKVSPGLAHSVESAASTVGQKLFDLTSAAKENAPALPRAEDSGPVIRPGGEVTENRTSGIAQQAVTTASNAGAAVQTAASSAAEAVRPTEETQTRLADTAHSAMDTVRAYLPTSLAAATSAPHFTVIGHETGQTAGIEAPGTRKQVQPDAPSTSADAAAAAASPQTAPAHSVADYASLAAEKVREMGNKAAEYLPSGEQQEQAAATTGETLASTAASTRETLAPAASTAAEQASHGASAVGHGAAVAAGAVASAVAVGAESVRSHLPTRLGGAAVEGESASSAQASTINQPALSTKGQPTAPSTLDSAEKVKEQAPDLSRLRGDSAYSTSGTATIFRGDAGEPDAGDIQLQSEGLKAITEEGDPSTRGKEEDRKFDLRQSHEEPAFDQPVATHDPYPAVIPIAQTGASETSFSQLGGNPAGSDSVAGVAHAAGGKARFAPGQEGEAYPQSADANPYGTAPVNYRNTAGYENIAGGVISQSNQVPGVQQPGGTGAAASHPSGFTEQETTPSPLPPDVNFTGRGSPHTYSDALETPGAEGPKAPPASIAEAHSMSGNASGTAEKEKEKTAGEEGKKSHGIPGLAKLGKVLHRHQ